MSSPNRSPNRNDRKQSEKTKIEMEIEKQEKNDGKKKREWKRMLVCRKWTGRWPRHWFLLVFIDHVPNLLGRLCPLTEILAWDGRRVESKKSATSHISYRGQHGFSSISSKLAQGLPEDINQTVASAARRSSRRAKNIGGIWLENWRKLLYSFIYYYITIFC